MPRTLPRSALWTIAALAALVMVVTLVLTQLRADAAGVTVPDEDLELTADLVITQDVPLAARVVPKGAAVIQTNGRVLDQESIDEALAMRDFAENLRDSGLHTGGPAPFSPKNKQAFSNALDRWITKRR